MTHVLTFKVAVEGLEDKIWRKIEITDSKTVAELAYTILATFNSLAYHLYEINHRGITYDSMIDVEDYYGPKKIVDATITKLNELDFSKDIELIMNYDFGSTNTFIITFLYSRDLEKGKGTHYPYVIEGQGRGILDDLCSYELANIVKETDKLGKSNFYFTPGYEREMIYDYRNYDIKIDNVLLKGRMERIKEKYEYYEEDE